jgi:hypothetical protein
MELAYMSLARHEAPIMRSGSRFLLEVRVPDAGRGIDLVEGYAPIAGRPVLLAVLEDAVIGALFGIRFGIDEHAVGADALNDTVAVRPTASPEVDHISYKVTHAIEFCEDRRDEVRARRQRRYQD